VLRLIEEIGKKVRRDSEPCSWSYERQYRAKAYEKDLHVVRRVYYAISRDYDIGQTLAWGARQMITGSNSLTLIIYMLKNNLRFAGLDIQTT